MEKEHLARLAVALWLSGAMLVGGLVMTLGKVAESSAIVQNKDAIFWIGAVLLALGVALQDRSDR
jgi:hypothetical protein